MIPLSMLTGSGGQGGLALSFDIAARIVEILLEAIIRITAFADGLPWSHFSIVSPLLPVVLLYYGLLFFLLSETFRVLLARRQLRIILAAFVLITAVFALSFAVPACQRENSALVFVDVGQGDCLHIRTPEGRNYLIDGGGAADYNVGRNILRAYLLKNGIGRLDGVFVSHLHRDHYGGIRELSLEMPIDRLFLYDGNRIRTEKVLMDTGFLATQLVPLSRGDRAKLGRDVWLDVLYPPKLPSVEYQSLMADDADENKSSLLMRLYYRGVTVLMTGDMGEVGEQEILRLGAPTVDILKVGHHGSRTSTTEAFLKEVKPKLAVIQVGRNNFGHPTQTVLDRLEESGIPVYRNDLDGAILMDIKNGAIRIKTLCDSP
jgi:competence protein ComEC